MCGIDKLKRYFLVMKLIINGRIYYQTLFQRYSDVIGDWRGCGHHSPEMERERERE